MERKKVNASNMRSVGYDPKAEILEIEFSDGKIIQYSRVSSEVQRRFMASPSMKSYFEDNIAENYSAKRIRG
jgi:KTSC domain